MSVHLDENRSGWTVMEANTDGSCMLTRHLRPSPPLELALERALVAADMKGRWPLPISVCVERDMLVLRAHVDGLHGNPLGLVWPLTQSKKLEMLAFLDEENLRLLAIGNEAAPQSADASLTAAALEAVQAARYLLTTDH